MDTDRRLIKPLAGLTVFYVSRSLLLRLLLFIVQSF